MKSPAYFFDFGNTRAKFWRCQGDQEEAHWAAPHGGHPEKLLLDLPAAFDEVPSGIYGASVLGAAAERRFSAAAVARWGRAPEFARTEPCFDGLRNGYRGDPSKLGVDRWLGIIGAASDCEVLCVVGCGTAITMDIVAGNDHLGGYILPGLGLMQGSLLQGTQRVRFERQASYALVPGNTTADAVHNAAMMAIVAFIERVAEDSGAGRLVLTGGDATLIGSFLRVACQVDHGLLLKGMMRYFAHTIGSPMPGVPQEVRG